MSHREVTKSVTFCKRIYRVWATQPPRCAGLVRRWKRLNFFAQRV